MASEYNKWRHKSTPCVFIRGNSVCILSISSERIGIFQLNLATLIQVSIEVFWHSYTWIWNICTCANCSYSLLHVINKSLDMIWILNLHWGYFLINEVRQWFNQIDHLTFSKIVFWSVNSALPFVKFVFANIVQSSRKVTWPHSWRHLVIPFSKRYP